MHRDESQIERLLPARTLQEVATILATAYLRFLPKERTNPATVGHLVASEDSPESVSERLDFPAGSPMTCAGQGSLTARPERG
jgi:hypothetical protein